MQPDDKNPINEPDVSPEQSVPSTPADEVVSSPQNGEPTQSNVDYQSDIPASETDTVAGSDQTDVSPEQNDSQVVNTEAAASTQQPAQPAQADAATQQPEQVAETNPAPQNNTPAAAPAAVVTGVAAVENTNGNKPGKGKKKLALLLGIVAVIILLLAGGAAAYFGVVVPNQPQKITQDALTNTLNEEKVKTIKFEGDLIVSGGEISKGISGVSFEGAVGENHALNAKLTLNTAVTKISLDLRSPSENEIYLRLSGLNGIDKLIGAFAGETGGNQAASFAAQFAPIIASLNDQWISIDKSLLQQFGEDAVPTDTNQLSDADAKKVGELYKQHQFIKIDKKLDDQDIHGVSSYHVQASIDKAKLKSFLEAVKAANIKELPVEQSVIEGVDKIDFNKYPFEMWVSKKDRMITQLQISTKEKETSFKLRVALFDFNKPVNVEKPANAKSIMELMGGLGALSSVSASSQ